MNFYLRNAAGVFLQLCPGLLLCYLPFPEESLRFPAHKVLRGAAVCTAAASALFPVALSGWYPFFSIMVEETGSGLRLTGNLLFCLEWLMGIAIFFWMVRETAIKKMLSLFLVIFYVITQYWLVRITYPFLPFGQEGSLYSVRTIVLYAVTMAAMAPFMAAISRAMKDYFREIAPDKMLREFAITMATMAVYLALMMYCSAVHDDSRLEYSRLYGPLFLCLMLSECLIYWLLFRETVRRKRNDENQQIIQFQQISAEKIAMEVENASRMRHDVRHHLNALYAMLEQGEPGEAKNYLKGLMDDIAGQEVKVYCRNFTVNALLQFYAGRAREEKILCQIHADCGDVAVAPADLTAIFGNILENAIRACRRFPDPEKRWLIVRVGVIRGSMVIEVRNSCRHIRLSGRYQTAEGFLPADAFVSERAGGGAGLRSLAYTAEKYDGSAVFGYDEEAGIFTTRIRLNLHLETLRGNQRGGGERAAPEEKVCNYSH